MYKFAHIADTHLGANRHPALEHIELQIFNEAMDKCIEEKVDFILICGDLFHIGLPDLGIVNNCVKKLKEVQDQGIPVYVIFGSHDYNPNTDSIVDILDSAGLIRDIVSGEGIGGKIRLTFCVDRKTGAKITGIHARKGGAERTYYENLDTKQLEDEDGFKIFCLHAGLSEFKPPHMAAMETIPVSCLPKGFDYYAGGHIHQRIEEQLPDYQRIVYPGPIFSGYPRDFEETAKGEKRGFYIVSFDDKVHDLKFVELFSPKKLEYFEFDVTGRNSTQANRELLERIQNLEVGDKIVLLKIKGELSGGKTSDINTSQVRDILVSNGAIYVNVNRYGLTSKEFQAIKVKGEDPITIEKNLLRENIGAVKVSSKNLKGKKGIALAETLLKTMRIEAKQSESKRDYTSRITEEGLNILGIREVFE